MFSAMFIFFGDTLLEQLCGWFMMVLSHAKDYEICFDKMDTYEYHEQKEWARATYARGCPPIYREWVEMAHLSLWTFSSFHRLCFPVYRKCSILLNIMNFANVTKHLSHSDRHFSRKNATWMPHNRLPEKTVERRSGLGRCPPETNSSSLPMLQYVAMIYSRNQSSWFELRCFSQEIQHDRVDRIIESFDTQHVCMQVGAEWCTVHHWKIWPIKKYGSWGICAAYRQFTRPVTCLLAQEPQMRVNGHCVCPPNMVQDPAWSAAWGRIAESAYQQPSQHLQNPKDISTGTPGNY